MAEYKKIETNTTHEGQLLTVSLNAPKGNILDRSMMTEMIEAIQSQGSQPAVKGIVFRANGPHFSFGASVEEHKKDQARDMLKTFSEVFQCLAEVQKPLLASVRGQCLGGGMELVSFCHWIFASEDAAFGQPEIKLGVFPPIAALLLPRLMGQSAADALIISGQAIPAVEAHKQGLVYSVSKDPDQTLIEFFEAELLSKSAKSLQFAARASRYQMYQSFFKDLQALEKLYVDELMETNDANEGISSFLEKRKPAWQNA